MIAKGNSYFWTSVSRTFCTQNQLSGTSEMNHTMTFKFPSIFCQSDEPANDTRGLLPVSTSFLQILTHIVIAVWFNAQRGNYGENVPLVQVTPSSQWLWEGRRREMIYTAHPSDTANSESQNLCSYESVEQGRRSSRQANVESDQKKKQTDWFKETLFQLIEQVVLW